ncbi:hypothetical protein CCUS01_00093 [Colletotrichum cuscutae]|uniref:Uncharacterized protein n=1 Tax=Colletotrichum cuscutae TaxID=1209917 RepID=A0AAI9YDY3_9PEZI|nr:hypothetical protein CCUS01_00093 [Colletotrichum cuscutae]
MDTPTVSIEYFLLYLLNIRGLQNSISSLVIIVIILVIKMFYIGISSFNLRRSSLFFIIILF